jgi:cellulose synthase/poly-beta-1,6-N-acetylglucosamine synthase-like glycosyltransferase
VPDLHHHGSQLQLPAAACSEPLPEDELPFVSVIIPAFCEEEVIAHSVAAALKIDYPDFEVIVVNDGSTDRPQKRFSPFSETRAYA